ncbi:MAG: hypothetical protein QXI12_05220 [Candidatus Methanomethyliaceae archaeon]
MSEKKNRMIYIWCSESTYRAFRVYAANYKNYEEAMRSLLIKAGVIKEGPVF